MDKTAILEHVTKATTVLVAFAVLSGCGYHLKGMGLTAPVGVRTVAVTVLENRTSESGIETVFTSDLAYEFTRSKVLQVVDSEQADAVLSGQVKSMSVDTISHTADYASDERRVTITLDLVLKRTDGTIIWADRAVSARETFEVLPSFRVVTDRNRRVAIEALSKRLAEKVHTRILQDF